MSQDTDALIDPCPPVALPPGGAFPLTVTVPIRGLLLRDADDLAELNRLLQDIRRIPGRDKSEPERDPVIAEAVATYFWLQDRVRAGEFAAFPGQYLVGARKKLWEIGPDDGEAVGRAMKADPSLVFEQIVVVRVPDPNAPVAFVY